MRSLKFNLADAERAADAWGANCGPAAIAAVADLTLEQVRPHLGDFEDRRFMNPTMMAAALRNAGVRFTVHREHAAGAGLNDLPFWGICRVQWDGPWMRQGVPERARYPHTHWVGACHPRHGTNPQIFDINCIADGGWVALGEWMREIVPLLTGAIPRATGEWHITHRIEVDSGGEA